MKTRFVFLLSILLASSLLPPTAAAAADAAIDSTKPVAVTSWQPNRLDVFAKGKDNTIKHKIFNGRWSAWQSIGGVVTSGPAAVARASGHLDVFARGIAGDLQHRSYLNGAWTDWKSLGGGLTDEPTVASWASNRLDVFVRGNGNAIFHRAWNGSGWGVWANIGGVGTSSPTAVSWGPSRLDVFVRGTNNQLYHKTWAGSWSANWVSRGGALTSAPSVLTGGSGFLTVYARTSNNQLAELGFGYNQWTDWKNLGGTLTTAPAADSWDGGHHDVLAFTTGGDLRKKTWHGFYGWAEWETVPESGPPRSTAPFTPTVAIQTAPASGAQVGGLAYAYVNNLGQLVSGYQPDPAYAGSLQWTVISGLERFSGPPALIEQPADRKVQVSGLHMSGDIWSKAQTAPGSSTWTEWVNRGGAMVSAVTAFRQADNSIVLLALDSAGGLWSLSHPGVPAPYRNWTSLGITGLAAPPAAVPGRDGLQLFVTDAAGQVHTGLLSPSGTVAAWTPLGGSGLAGTPAAVVYPGYQMRVFSRTADGTILTKAQDSTLAWPANWSQVGQPGIAAGSPAAVLSSLSGRTELVVRGVGGAVFSSGETAQGSGLWRDWTPVLQGTDSAATDPTILSYNDGSGSRWAFLFRTSDQESRMYTVNTGFSALNAVGDRDVPAFTAASLPAPPEG